MDKKILKQKLIVKQNNHCFYCNIKFDYNHKYKIPTLEHRIAKMYVGNNTKFVCSCFKCNMLKGNISEELFLDGYIMVNHKYTYDGQSENKAIKVRKPIKWYQRLFPNLFWRNKEHYKKTFRLYDL